MSCNRKDICSNYPSKCDLCRATSDVVVYYPCFQDKDIVGVVRCKDCKWWHTVGCAFRKDCVNGLPSADDFCSYGERSENGNK